MNCGFGLRTEVRRLALIRAHLAEFGVVARVGRNGVEALLDVVADSSGRRLPEVPRACLAARGAFQAIAVR